jgi:hypothetical protein
MMRVFVVTSIYFDDGEVLASIVPIDDGEQCLYRDIAYEDFVVRHACFTVYSRAREYKEAELAKSSKSGAQWLTPAEIAKESEKFSKDTIRDFCRQRIHPLPHFPKGAHFLIRRGDWEQWTNEVVARSAAR